MLRTTMGQLLVNNSLPEDMRDYGRVLDKKGMNAVLRDVAQRYPEKYPEISKKLADIGRNVASEFGGNSASLAHMSKAKAGRKYQQQVRMEVQRILANDSLTDEQRHAAIIRAAGRVQGPQADEILAESVAENNPYASQVISGSRGNKMNLASLRGSDWLYADHRDEPIPLPIYHSYAEGLKPIEFWAGSYGARKGIMSTKFATQDAGFLSKQLNQVAHRLVVVDHDYPHEREGLHGLPVDVGDPDNAGALLAHDVGPYKKNTHLTPKILRDIQRRGHDRILVRSPLVGGSPDGGVYARDVGVREHGVLPGRGEQVGLLAAQALSEPLSQAQLGAKHTGGVAGQDKAVGGFQYINQLIQVPKVFKAGAAHAQDDGRIERIEDAPAGGKYVWVGSKRHYIGSGYDLKVKEGDEIEAGDRLSEGAANPSDVTHLRGIGEGRYHFTNTMMEAMKGAGLKANRRNVELLARGLINHVRLTDEYAGHLPGDVIPYSTLEHLYEPRHDHQRLAPRKSAGHYLEQPVLHYTIGTKIRPSVIKELERFGVKDVAAHPEPPPFEPEMIRGMYSLQHDPDWMTRMYGSGLKGGLLEAVHRGRKSDEAGTSFVPSLARAVDFGRVGPVRQPEKGVKPPDVEVEDDMKKRTPIQQLTLPQTVPAPPKSSGPLSSWLKLSCDQVEQLREAEALVKQAAGTYTGSSTTDASGHTNRPTGQASGNPAPGVSSSGAPQGGSTSSHWNVNPRMAGIAHDPQQFAQFIQGGHQYGGDMGAAMNFFSGLDPEHTATLTGGSGYDRPMPMGYMPGTGRPGMGGFNHLNQGAYSGGGAGDWGQAMDPWAMQQNMPPPPQLPTGQQAGAGGPPKYEGPKIDPFRQQDQNQWSGRMLNNIDSGMDAITNIANPLLGIGQQYAQHRMLKSMDPNGEMFERTYDPRQMAAAGTGLGIWGGTAMTQALAPAGSRLAMTAGAVNPMLQGAASRAGTAAVYYQVAKGLGENLGDAYSDLREGTFLGGQGHSARRTNEAMQSVEGLVREGASGGERAMSALQLANPITSARVIGGSIGGIANAVGDIDRSNAETAAFEQRSLSGQMSDQGYRNIGKNKEQNFLNSRVGGVVRDRMRKKMTNYEHMYGGMGEVTPDMIHRDLGEQGISSRVMEKGTTEEKRQRKLYDEMTNLRDSIAVSDNIISHGRRFNDHAFLAKRKERLADLEKQLKGVNFDKYKDKMFEEMTADQKKELAEMARGKVHEQFGDTE